MPSSFPPPRGVPTQMTLLHTVVALDSKYPLRFRLVLPPSLGFFPSVTSSPNAYVVYTFEVGVRLIGSPVS